MSNVNAGFYNIIVPFPFRVTLGGVTSRYQVVLVRCQDSGHIFERGAER